MILIKSLKWLHRIIYRIRIYYIQLFYSYSFFYTKRLALCCDIRCGIGYVGKKKTKFPHPVGVVIGIGVELGHECMIFQNVTIGTKSIFAHDFPKIGDKVIIGANSVLIGNITIGNNVLIGASSFVNVDLPENAIAVGNPAKIIGYRK